MYCGPFIHKLQPKLIHKIDPQVEWFDYAFLPSSLTWLDISSNLVTELSNFYGLSGFRLQVLEAGDNRVSRIGPGSFLDGLFHIRLDRNRLEDVDLNTFSGLDNLQSVDLRFNRLQHLSSEALFTSYKNVHGEQLHMYAALDFFANSCLFLAAQIIKILRTYFLVPFYILLDFHLSKCYFLSSTPAPIGH
jgi:hypothetical protein